MSDLGYTMDSPVMRAAVGEGPGDPDRAERIQTVRVLYDTSFR